MEIVRLMLTNCDTGQSWSWIDEQDYPLLSQSSWSRISKDGTRFYTNGYIPGFGYTTVHAIVMYQMTGLFACKADNTVVDHIDGDGLNNVRSNLRLVTQGQNMMNKRRKLNGTSRFKGVHWDESRLLWQARIAKDRKQYMLGRFNREVDAAVAYNVKAIELFGEHAWLNEITAADYPPEDLASPKQLSIFD